MMRKRTKRSGVEPINVLATVMLRFCMMLWVEGGGGGEVREREEKKGERRNGGQRYIEIQLILWVLLIRTHVFPQYSETL